MVPSTHVAANIYNSKSEDAVPLYGYPGTAHTEYTDEHTGKAPIHINKNLKKFKMAKEYYQQLSQIQKHMSNRPVLCKIYIHYYFMCTGDFPK